MNQRRGLLTTNLIQLTEFCSSFSSHQSSHSLPPTPDTTRAMSTPPSKLPITTTHRSPALTFTKHSTRQPTTKQQPMKVTDTDTTRSSTTTWVCENILLTALSTKLPFVHRHTPNTPTNMESTTTTPETWSHSTRPATEMSSRDRTAWSSQTAQSEPLTTPPTSTTASTLSSTELRPPTATTKLPPKVKKKSQFFHFLATYQILVSNDFLLHVRIRRFSNDKSHKSAALNL